MPIFGNVDKFAIEYQFMPSPFEEDKVLKQSWGIFRLWVMGQDVCEYTINGVLSKYEWNLIYIVEWLCNNLEYVLGYDPFPLPVNGKNSLELIRESDKFESEEDDEFYLWYQAKSSWIFRHSWFSNRAGSILASVYFRRIEDNIELAWDNGFWEESQVYFSKPKGVCSVSKGDFKEAIFSFLTYALDQLESNLGGNAQIDGQSIAALRRKLNLLK
ncbi:hypothetical protein [Sporomusa acidovorans]|uniref:Uncharacterized protein n=1 Tax=Sporomusa acidovorans (strain ATCC 49682 / DSM 3132 / Mol) TaxID=1123286 RepID=A0ABZ3J688_SPOA4|nr:hypothetical protein [Sporomusa acidovorans]OZC24257.1 hypothetical protein SPACI_00870 [Sporomusa acidovorans DSM 3132]SDF88319.1 hypothetical protein SAMN04488499_11172 [Sporomusa acidovorans]